MPLQSFLLWPRAFPQSSGWLPPSLNGDQPSDWQVSRSLTARTSAALSNFVATCFHESSRHMVTGHFPPHKPTAFNTQIPTATTMTTFQNRFDAGGHGIKRLVSHNATPTTISATTISIRGISLCSSRLSADPRLNRHAGRGLTTACACSRLGGQLSHKLTD
jgi:hypothetical protein